MKLTIRFYLREDAPKTNGNIPIYIDARVNKKRVTFSTGLYTLPKWWNERELKVKLYDPWHERTNKRLTKIKKRIAEIEDDCISDNKTVSPTQFKNLVLNTSASSACFIEYMEQKLEQRKEIIKPQTITTNIHQIAKLKEFQKEITFLDLDYDFIKRYEGFLTTTRQNKESTVSKSMSFLKLMINEAIKDERFKSTNPFIHYKIKRVESDREYLDEDELERLEELYRSKKLTNGEQIVLTTFLFSCYTGVRYGHIRKLTINEILNDKNGQFVRTTTEKSYKLINVPLISKAVALIPEGLIKNQRVFKVYTNQPTNRHLKKIAEKARIDKNVSFHVSRHTFATLSGVFGIPVEIVRDLLGHSDIKTTLLYRKTTKKQLWSEMDKWEKPPITEEIKK